MNLSSIDISIVIVYCIFLIWIAWRVSQEKTEHKKDSSDYFLAGKSLPWWAVGSSLIAANISAEQIIGMSGSGFAVGLGIASYEWMAAITLLLVGKYFIPVFLERKIFTMPQFLEQRFDGRVRSIMAVFWLGVYVFVNLTSVLYLGALAIHAIVGIDLIYGMIFLIAFSMAYSIYGGLKAVAMTDIIQVVLLIFGGMTVTYLALDKIGAGNAIQGFNLLTSSLPEKFDMILDSDNPYYKDLPGISVLVGGMWVMNFSYWGFNQYITQRALAAKNLREAQKGIALAAYLKILMPLIVVLPGIAAAMLIPDLEKPDQAYPEMMKLVPVGFLGITFAALVAAIASSLSSMSNSVSTIFTMDIYKHKINPDASEKQLLFIGRLSAVIAMLIAMLLAKPLLGDLDQAFQYIQEFTGFFTPGIVVIFMLGIFWKGATANGALAAAIVSALASLILKLAFPALPFMDRIGIVFVLCIFVCVVISKLFPADASSSVVELSDIKFATTPSFNYASFGVVIILISLYATWW